MTSPQYREGEGEKRQPLQNRARLSTVPPHLPRGACGHPPKAWGPAATQGLCGRAPGSAHLLVSLSATLSCFLAPIQGLNGVPVQCFVPEVALEIWWGGTRGAVPTRVQLCMRARQGSKSRLGAAESSQPGRAELSQKEKKGRNLAALGVGSGRGWHTVLESFLTHQESS